MHMAEESGIETPTADDLVRIDRAAARVLALLFFIYTEEAVALILVPLPTTILPSW
jgi:hypothetical protein